MIDKRRYIRRFHLTKRAVLVQKMLNLSSFHFDLRNMRIHPVVFESDDWGMCGETKDRNTLNELLEIEHGNARLDKMKYNNTLESSDDLEALFWILKSREDSLGRPAIFTANHVMSNPDFRMIESSGFKSYHYVPISLGFPENWARGDVKNSWLRGIKMGVWRAEFHALHHFNYKAWLRSLQSGEKYTRRLFDLGVVYYPKRPITISEYVLNARAGRYERFKEQMNMIYTGCKIFRDVFGYWPESTIPPHDIWNFDTELAFFKCGLRYIQTERNRPSAVLLPSYAIKSPMKSALAGIMIASYFVKVLRNIWLEPDDSLEYALEAYNYIIKNDLCAVVGTHRVNYVSTVNPGMCSEGRRKLSDFLNFLTEDDKLVFLTVSELSQLILRGYSIFVNYNSAIIRNYTNNVVKISCPFNKCEVFDLTHDMYLDANGNMQEGKMRVPCRTTLLLNNRQI